MTATISFSKHDQIIHILGARNAARRVGDFIIVPTDILLPNGLKLVVTIEGGAAGDRITASDGGAALTGVAEAGFLLGDKGYAAVRRRATELELSMEEGVIRSTPVDPDQVSYAVALLANGARELAEAAFDFARKHERDRFRERVALDLNRIFSTGSVQRGAHLQGQSENQLKFDYLVTVSNILHLIIDAPVPEPSSIASVVLRQADVKAAGLPGFRQAIVYDEADSWPSTSLAQLRLAQVPLVSSKLLQAGLIAAIG